MIAIYDVPEGPRPKKFPNWFGVFDHPINSMTYEDIQDPEIAEAIAKDLTDTADIFRVPRDHGWSVEID